MSQSAKSVTLASHFLEAVYTNWRGETGLRRIVPISVSLGSTEWHPKPQWFLRGVDLDKGEEREFALKDFGRPPLPVEVLDIFLDCDADGTPPDVRPEDMDSPLGRRWLEMFRLMKEVCGISRQTTGRVLEQADMLDGRVAQTVRMPSGEEIVRHVPAEEVHDTDYTNFRYYEAKARAELAELRLAQFRGSPLSAAAIDVLSERQRQIEGEGWTTGHDDLHPDGELACAAGCYALVAAGRIGGSKLAAPMFWPWDLAWFKPSGGPRRMLVKAAALILAEIERRDRKASQEATLPNGVELRATVHHGPRPANDDRQDDVLHRGRAE